jgi:hypothetical protein
MFAERVDLLSTILVNFNVGASAATDISGNEDCWPQMMCHWQLVLLKAER